MEESKQDMFKNILSGDEELTEESYDAMMKEWMSNGAEMQNMGEMNKAMNEWGKTWDQDVQLNQQMGLQMPQKQNII